MIRPSRRMLMVGFLAGLLADFGPANGAPVGDDNRRLLGFWLGLPATARAYLADDIKLLIGWTFDAAAVKRVFAGGAIVDGTSGFSSVPGFAAPTPMTALKGRFRVLRSPFDRGGGYYGIELAGLNEADAAVAVLLTNRLFRMPIALEDPLGLATDVVTNGAMLTGVKTSSHRDAVRGATHWVSQRRQI